jgi:small-conductance mechanosensitive channel
MTFLQALYLSPVTVVVLRILALFVLFMILRRIVGWESRRWMRQAEQIPDPDRSNRSRTLIHAGGDIAQIALFLLFLLMGLGAVGIDVTPILAGAGILGLGISLGAQNLFKDWIGGILILAENQFSVGDVVSVGSVTGGVERMTLRATYLRDYDGRLHILPNGDVHPVANLTAGWARTIVDFNISYRESMDRVLGALHQAAEQAAADPAVAPDLLERPEVSGWIGMGDWAVTARMDVKTKPGKQWGIGNTLRQYGLEALRQAGISVALPAREVHWQGPEPPRG